MLERKSNLDQARAHLLECQGRLRSARMLVGGVGRTRREVVGRINALRKRAETKVLAALSWVWDEQERKRETDWSKMTQAEIFADLSRLLPFAGPITEGS